MAVIWQKYGRVSESNERNLICGPGKEEKKSNTKKFKISKVKGYSIIHFIPPQFITLILGGIYMATAISPSVKDFGAKGDYNPITETGTDDTKAFQTALSTIGKGGVLLIPQGHYLIKSSLTTPDRSLIRGLQTFQFGVGPADGITLHFKLPSGATAMTLGANSNIEGFILRGEGAQVNAIGLTNTGSGSQMRDLGVYGFNKGIILNDSFYIRMTSVEIAYCANGLWLNSGIYNLDLYGCVFRQTGNGIRIFTPVKGLNLYGGSIEHFGGGGGLWLDDGSAGSVVNLFGVYFEAHTDGANGITVDTNNNTFNMIGNMVYLSKVNRWFSASGRTDTIINSHGNKFRNTEDNLNNSIAYFLPPSGYCNIYGDNWGEVTHGTYVGNAGMIKEYKIDVPKGA
ncbi:MAG: glycoside hydrolase family 55 protein [Sporolactobacillus sp.]|jgi:polygalacturonase|nr:glycoside hydrolase family 55 protein [Sporolactobacillus sp.]